MHKERCSFWPCLCPEDRSVDDDPDGGDRVWDGLLLQSLRGDTLRPQLDLYDCVLTLYVLLDIPNTPLSSSSSPSSPRTNMIALHRCLMDPHVTVLVTDRLSSFPDLNLKESLLGQHEQVSLKIN